MNKKLAIVVGHNVKSQGARRTDNGVTEFVYNSELAAKIEKLAQAETGIDVKVFFRVAVGGYTAEISRVYGEVDAWGADASIELHFNASGDPKASGTETITSGSKLSTILASEVQMSMVEELGLRDRGILIRNGRTKGRGYQSLVSGKCPAVLIEPFFGSSPVGTAATDSDYEKEMLAASILNGAKAAFNKF